MSIMLMRFLTMSFSGSLLILVLLIGKRFWKDKLSRQWQYYIWLIVILRLLLPFGAEPNLLGKTYQTAGQAITEAASQPHAPAQDSEPPHEPPVQTTRPLPETAALTAGHIWLLWLAAALIVLIRKVTVYQSFIRYISAGLTPVSDIEALDRLSLLAERLGVRRPVELCVNPLISSPLLTGFFHPCIVLPSADISQKDFQYIVLHELTHYKRVDMFYKWLVQFTVCLHWFNPLVYLMSREITRACEFSCDEAVLTKTGYDCAQDYGKTLLDAMAAVGTYRETIGSVTLSENKELLKERLGAIMNFKMKSTEIRLLTGMLTLCVIFGAAFIGVYPAAAADAGQPTPPRSDGSPVMETLDLKGTTYYLVSSEAQLRAIGTGEYGMDQNYMQQADIQLSTDEWAPIGTWDDPFTGTFNGNGFEIIGLTMTNPDAEIIGLFGVAKQAHIHNVTVRDYDIVSAGRNAQRKSVGAILAVGQGSRSYDNSAYPKEAGKKNDTQTASWASTEIKKYYEADSLPLFQIVFSRLTQDEQSAWLDKTYADGKIAFFSAAVNQLSIDSPLIAPTAEKLYQDGSISFFSVLTYCMGRETLESWLDRALEDGRWNFQSILFDKLDMDDELDALEEELAQKQLEEYRAAGVTKDGKNYYYQGKLVNVFLDMRPNKSFYTLDINPAGTVNVKMIRGEDGQITGAAYMTEAEAADLLGDDEDDGF